MIDEFWTPEMKQRMTMKEVFDLADVLIRQKKFEDKLFGILLLRKMVPFIDTRYMEKQIEYLYHDKFIYQYMVNFWY